MRTKASEPQGLERFVLPVDQAPMLDEAGFLLPPGPGWPVSEGKEQPRAVVDLVARGVSFALLAAGGAGKSTTFSALRAREPGAVLINVAPLGRDEFDRRISACRDSEVVFSTGWIKRPPPT